MRVKILNLGCGDETYGTHFVDRYPSRPKVIKCNIDEEKLPFPDNFFDEVYSRNLLEHAKNVGFVLKEMVRVTKKGGTLIIVTDNASYYLFHLNKSYSAHYFNYRQHGAEDKHYALFTTKHLENFFEGLGLKLIKLSFLTWYEPKNENPIIKYPEWGSKLAIPNRILGRIPFMSHMAFPRILAIAKKL
jgi:SAM-dependent methyltransferase